LRKRGGGERHGLINMTVGTVDLLTEKRKIKEKVKKFRKRLGFALKMKFPCDSETSVCYFCGLLVY